MQTSLVSTDLASAASYPQTSRASLTSLSISISDWLDGIFQDCREQPVPFNTVRSQGRVTSTPTMNATEGAGGVFIPPTSVESRSVRNVNDQASMITTSSRSSNRTGKLIEDPSYRIVNLAAHHIYLLTRHDPLPLHIQSLIDYIYQASEPPGPSVDAIYSDDGLEALELSSGESDVQSYFGDTIFTKPRPNDALRRSEKLPMSKQSIPAVLGCQYKISNPVPDMLFGYSRTGAFSQQQTLLNITNNEGVSNSLDLLYPFLVIEFKADGPCGAGSLWAATNQCLGGATSCVFVGEKLNQRLQGLRIMSEEEVQKINTAAFSVAMSGTEARIFVSWKHDPNSYHTAKIKSFCLQDAEQYLVFRKWALNIISWGRGERLRSIKSALDALLTEQLRVDLPEIAAGGPDFQHRKRRRTTNEGESEVRGSSEECVQATIA